MSATNDDVLHQKAFDFAQEIIKQVITLSAGIITGTITFFKDFAGPDAPPGARVMMSWS